MPRMWLPLLIVILSRSFTGSKSNPPNIVIFLADDLGKFIVMDSFLIQKLRQFRVQ